MNTVNLIAILKSVSDRIKKFIRPSKKTFTTINIYIDNIVVQVNTNDVNVSSKTMK